MTDSDDALIAEQLAYYRAIAPEYERHAIAVPGAEDLRAAFDAFRPTGDVLELAGESPVGGCGRHRTRAGWVSSIGAR